MNLQEFKKISAEDQLFIYNKYKEEKKDFTQLMNKRVTSDIKINTNLFVKQLTQLRELYEGDEQKVESLINFLNTKAKVYKMHQDNPLRVDIKKGEKNKEILEGFIQEKVDILAEVMPETPIKAKKKKPKVFYKKDGTLSASAVKWLEFLESHGLPEDHEEEVEYIRGYKKPNPQSPTQQKEWLFSLGWVPEIYNETINVAGEVNKVPQLKDKEKNLCKSVLSLVEKEPAIKELDDLGVLQHRLGLVKGFLRDVNEKGEIVAGIAGLTNCVTADTVITTNRGAIPICEVTKEDQVLTHKGVWKRVTDFINNGVKPVYRITTSKGKSIKCTAKHRFYTGDEKWVFAEDIKCGQEVYGYGDKEIWKPVGSKQNPNFISSWGRYTNRKGKTSSFTKRVHKDVREFCSYTTDSGENFEVQRARLVLEKFRGISSLHVLHKDGKSCNNNVANLYYGTDKENHHDSKIHGTLVKAHRNRVNSKLKHSDIKDIKKRITEGETNVSIAKSYGVSNSLISQIKNNKRWSEEKNIDNRYVELFEKETVISIEKVTPEPTFDISVEEDHSYIANGLVTHNTLRIRHKILVNMPKPSAPYGEYIRSLILPPKGHVMIGSDLSSLENITRNNFIIDIDPEYVAEMDDEFYDSHLDIGVTAGLITQAESIFYKWWKEKGKAEKFGKEVLPPETFGEVTEDFDIILNSYKTDEEKEEFHEKLDKIRAQAKTVNYSALYGVGKVKLSKELKITQKEAKQLLDAYWKKNDSVKKFASSCKVKTVGKQMWVKNPLNGYWYSLRTEKDIFSVVNQSAGDYIFTLWEHFLMEEGVIIRGGWHDEIVTTCKPEDSEKIVDKLKSAINKVNKVLKLKIPVGLDFKIDKNYSKVH